MSTKNLSLVCEAGRWREVPLGVQRVPRGTGRWWGVRRRALGTAPRGKGRRPATVGGGRWAELAFQRHQLDVVFSAFVSCDGRRGWPGQPAPAPGSRSRTTRLQPASPSATPPTSAVTPTAGRPSRSPKGFEPCRERRLMLPSRTPCLGSGRARQPGARRQRDEVQPGDHDGLTNCDTASRRSRAERNLPGRPECSRRS